MKINAWAAESKGAAMTPFSFDVEAPADHHCIIEVKACGICHSDIHMIDNDWALSKYPLVPGHEVVGEVVEVSSSVSHLKVGDRVGVGWQGAACMECPACRRGDENLCKDSKGLIVEDRGGFADHLTVDSRFAFRLPDGIDTSVAGPLLCGGVTVFSALRHAGMTSGKRVGVIGVGGLGHMAVQFARKLGNHVTAFTTSDDKAEFASELGAHEAVLVPKGEAPKPLSYGLDVLLNTVALELDWAAYIGLLAGDGTITFVAAPPSITVPFFPLLTQRRRVMGSPIGGRSIMGEMLDVADTHGVAPIVEVFPMAKINEALQKVRDNTVRYRAVLTP